MLMLLMLLVSAETSFRPQDLSDADIIRFQSAAYDKSLFQNTRVIVGRHRGATVVVDFPCSDICPNYTTRIIHYDVNPGPDCLALGGVERPVMVPMGVAVHREAFCVPAVLGVEIVREGN